MENFLDWVRSFTCVKSLVTLAMTACFIYLCVVGEIKAESFMQTYYIIISFYFGAQWEKAKAGRSKKDE